jgi:hypothetical protein
MAASPVPLLHLLSLSSHFIVVLLICGAKVQSRTQLCDSTKYAVSQYFAGRNTPPFSMDVVQDNINISSPVNSAGWPLWQISVHHVSSQQPWHVSLRRILPHVSSTFPQRLRPQSWVQNCRMTGEGWNVKDCEASGHGVIEDLSDCSLPGVNNITDNLRVRDLKFSQRWCCILSLCKRFTMFRKIIMPSSLGSRIVLIYPEDEGTKIVRNIEGCLPKDEV